MDPRQKSLLDDNEVIPWNGTTNVPPKGVELWTWVEVSLRNGQRLTNYASVFLWQHVESGADIIGYRIVNKEQDSD